MANATRNLLLLSMLSLAAAGCSSSGGPVEGARPVHPVLTGVTPPPNNSPLVAKPARRAEIARPPVLPTGPAPALMALRDGKRVTGLLNIGGRLTLEKNELVVTPDKGAPIRILYRTPAALPPIASLPSSANLDLDDRSGPGGANRRLVVFQAKPTVIFAEIWLSSAKPVGVPLAGSLYLAQQPVQSAPASSGFTAVSLRLMENEKVLSTFQPGQPVNIPTAGGTLLVYSQISHFHRVVEKDSIDFGDRYILRVWIVAESATNKPLRANPRLKVLD